MSFGPIKLAVMVGMVIAAFAGSANAQEFPGLGVSDMWANEVAFSNQFDA